jgi:hypothetical protein
MLIDFSNNFPTIVIGFISGVIATLLSGIGYFVKIWLENKRVMKVCLFNLLKANKTLGIIEFLESGKFEKLVLKKVKEMFPNESFSSQDDLNAQEYFRKFLNLSFTPILDKYLEELSNNYHSTVNKIARIKPLLAFNLNNQFYANQYIKDFGNVLSTNPQFANDINSELVKNTTQDILISDAKKDLKKDIIKIAFRSSKKTWFILKFRSKIFDKQLEQISPEIDNLMEHIEIHIKNNFIHN